MGNSEMRPLFDTAKQMASADGSRYRDIRSDRDELLAFMDINGWFGTTCPEDMNDPLIVITEEIQEKLEIWLRAYRKTDGEKVELLISLLEKRFPKAAERFREYAGASNNQKSRSAWRVLDFLLYRLEKELEEYSEEEINAVVAEAYDEMKMKELSLLTGYLTYSAACAPYTD